MCTHNLLACTNVHTCIEYKVATDSHTPITAPSPFNLCHIHLTISFYSNLVEYSFLLSL